MGQEEKVNKDAWPSRSQGLPIEVKEVKTIVVPITDAQKSASANSDQIDSNTSKETLLPYKTTRKSRCFSQTLQEAKKRVDAPKTSF